MKIYMYTLTLAALALALMSCRQAGEGPGRTTKAPTRAEDEAAIRAVYEKEVAAFQVRDAAAMAALQTADALFMAADQPTVVGREAIKSWRQAEFEWIAKEFSAGSLAEVVDEVEVAGEWAFARGTWTLTSTPKAGGKPTQTVGKWIDILRRQPDDSWQMSRCCWNRDTPPPSTGK